MLLASVSAQPEDCPEPMPALLFVQRIRHNDQCIYAGGWTINDNALYQDAVTMLVADAGPNVVPVSLDQSEDDGDESIRGAILSALDDERDRLGSVVYNGEIGENSELNKRGSTVLADGPPGGSRTPQVDQTSLGEPPVKIRVA